MYQPLGLECGHKFCADCALSSVGKGNALGTVRAILDHVAPRRGVPGVPHKGRVCACDGAQDHREANQAEACCLLSRSLWGAC